VARSSARPSTCATDEALPPSAGLRPNAERFKPLHHTPGTRASTCSSLLSPLDQATVVKEDALTWFLTDNLTSLLQPRLTTHV